MSTGDTAVLKQPAFVALALAMFGYGAVEWGNGNWFVSYASAALPFDTEQARLIFAFFTAGMVISRLGFAWFIPLLGSKKLLRVLVLLMVSGALLVKTMDSATALALGNLLLGLGLGGVYVSEDFGGSGLSTLQIVDTLAQAGNDSRIKVLLTAQDQHGTLRRGQGFDDRFDMLEDTPAFDMALGGQVFPELGSGAPVSAPVKSLAKTVAIPQIVEGHDATFAASAAAGLVEEDRIDPACERSASFEEIDAAEHSHPGVLDDFLRDVARPDDAGAKADHRGIVPAIEQLEDCSIPVNEVPRQSQIVTFILRHAAPCLSPGAISKTIAFHVQQHSTPSSHSDHRGSVAPEPVILQGERAFQGNHDD